MCIEFERLKNREKLIPSEFAKNREKSTQKILEIIRQNNFVTRAQIAKQIGLSDSGVKKQIRALQEQGILKRICPDKGGHWEISRG
jgi:predicted HTH transcriptional regulator